MYAEKQNHPLPDLPAGEFRCVCLQNHFVFMFKFSKIQPCSGVDEWLVPRSDKHIGLPIPGEALRGLASSYLYMREKKYDLTDEKQMSFSLQPVKTGLSEVIKTTRTDNLLKALMSRVENHSQ